MSNLAQYLTNHPEPPPPLTWDYVLFAMGAALIFVIAVYLYWRKKIKKREAKRQAEMEPNYCQPRIPLVGMASVLDAPPPLPNTPAPPLPSVCS